MNMDTKTSSALPKLIAEVIRRMTPQQRQMFFDYLPFAEITELYEQSGQTAQKEPFLYIRDREDGLSLEVPEETVTCFVKKLIELLQPQKITLRYITHDKKVEKRCSKDKFFKIVSEIQPILLNDSVVIEFDHHTLYSNGGGCMLLETDIGIELKKTIANFLLRINGYPEEKLEDNFTIMIKTDKDNGGSLEKVE